MIVYSSDGIEVHMGLDGFLRIRVWSRHINILPEELADIAEAVARHLEEPFFTEEDLEAGRRAIAELEVS